jgi:hypothetical protein
VTYSSNRNFVVPRGIKLTPTINAPGSGSQCPLLAQSRHEDGADGCLLSGVRRSLICDYEMSAFDP